MLPRFGRRTSYKFSIWRLKLLNNLTTVAILGTVVFLIFSFFLFLWYSRDLPFPDQVKRREGFSSLILDRNEKPLYDIYVDKNRIPIAFSDIPDFLKKATVSVEDKDFYSHAGFDPKGILRALFHMVTLRGVQGGSTLTQQLVKNVLLTSERSLPRKIKEFVLAIQIERKYTKDEILQMYLNEAPYGGTMWGIESAAQGYFGKHAKDLTPAESVILVGLPQLPSYYSPFGPNPKAYRVRSEEVLRRLREDGHITQLAEYEFKSQLNTVKFASPGAQFKAPHFVLSVKKQLTDLFGAKLVEEGGLRVTTTLDASLQEKAEDIVRDELEKAKSLQVSNGAVVALNPATGEILAYIGSKDYNLDESGFQGKFDVASMGYRQPGSALKPITYAAALSKGYTLSTVIADVETHFPGGKDKEDYIPKNYDNKFRGPTQLRFALGNSINIPAVKLTALVGVRDVLKLASDMGITTLAPTDKNIQRLGLSLTLGGGEVRLLDITASFGVFATGGIRIDPYTIEKVTDSTGKVLFEHRKNQGKRVLSEDISFLISHTLLDNASRKEVFGERSYLVVPGKTVSVKTGTTDDKRDNWTIGYTPSIVTGVWVGNNDNSPMNPKLASGATGAAPIWNRIMREALKNTSDEQPKKPDTVVALTVDSLFGGLPHEGLPTRNEYYIKGTEPTSLSPIYKKIKLSKSDNNKLANAVEIATGNFDEKEFWVLTENDPTSRDSKNRWQEGIDNWLSLQSEPKYHPPKDTSNTDENSVVVQITKPTDKTRVDADTVEITGNAKAVRDIKKIELIIDDVLKTSVNNNTLDETVVLPTGIHKIKLKAFDEKGNTGEKEVTIGVYVSAENPSPTPAPTISSP